MRRLGRMPGGGDLAAAAPRRKATGFEARSEGLYREGGGGASGGPELVFGGVHPAKRGRFVQMLRVVDGRAAGALWQTADGIVYRRVLTDLSRHLLRLPVPSFCFDCGAALEARRAGAVVAEVVERATGRAWRVGFDYLMTHGELLDRGHGEQLRLAVTEFEGPPLRAGKEPAQASLFGEGASR